MSELLFNTFVTLLVVLGPPRTALEVAIVIGVLLVVLLLVLLYSRVIRLFGETGANVLSRVLGVILAAWPSSSASRHPRELLVAERARIYFLK